MTKKVLIITYYWPPSGGAGVQRWVKLSKYLSRLGVEVHVLTVDGKLASYPSLDYSLQKDIDPEIKIYKTKSFEILKMYAKVFGKDKIPGSGFTKKGGNNFLQNISMFLRSNFFIPDPRKGWNNYAYKKAISIIQKENIENVITTSPPHSTQLIGLKLKRKLNVNWIADLRDPWIDIFYYNLLNHSLISNKINKLYEKSVIFESDTITSTSSVLNHWFIDKYDTINVPLEKFNTIYNGFDEEDFEGKRRSNKMDNFVVCYTGTMSEQYNPEVFFTSLEKVSLAHPDKKIKFQFVGKASEVLLTFFKTLRLDFQYIGILPHSEVTQYQIDADLLLLIVPDVPNDFLIVPGKLFEYLATGNKIISLGPEKGDIVHILQKCDGGKSFSRNDESLIAQYVENILLSPPPTKNKYKENKISKYSRINQAKEFEKIIKR